MIDRRYQTVDDALSGIEDGASIMVSGFGGAGVPVALIEGLGRTSARNLTVVTNSLRFLDYHAPTLFHERRIVKGICTAARGREKEPSIYEKQWQEGFLEFEILPQGTFSERIRAAGAGIPAFFTPTGVGTTLVEGKEHREFGGRTCVLELAITADYAIMRGQRADRWGNVIFHGTQANFGPAMAAASKCAIVEVEEISETPLDPQRVDIPGIYVDRVVAVPTAGKE